MKKSFIILFFLNSLFVFEVLKAQNVEILESNWYAFANKVDVSEYIGRNFVLESDIKVERGKDSSGMAGMWARADKKKGYGFFDNMSDRPIVSNNWQTYKIEGVIDSGAIQLVFGGICYYNGNFFYNNFRLKVATETGWKNIIIPNGDFENKNEVGWTTGIGRNKINVKGYNLVYEKDIKNKNTVLKVKGEGIATYGISKTNGKYFETNGVKIYYEVYGSGEPLLLLHGNGQSIEAFEKQIPFFSKRYRVIIPDCRGRGNSSDNDAELTYDIQASDINNLLDHLNVDSANVIGWSDGGIIGLIMAKDYSKKVKKLIASGANVQQDTFAYFPKDYEGFKTLLADTSFKGMNRKLINLMTYYPSIPFAELNRIKCPTLIVAGDNDEIRIGHTVKIFESIPKAQLFIVPKTSHYVLSENPKVFNEAALKFFKEN